MRPHMQICNRIFLEGQTVVECTSPLSYKVKTATHGVVRRHQDQLRTTVSHDTHDLTPEIPVSLNERLNNSQRQDDTDEIENQIQTSSNSQTSDAAKDPASTQVVDSTLDNTNDWERGSNSEENVRRVPSPENTRVCTRTRSGRVVKPP